MQPTHATCDMRWAEARLGPERVARRLRLAPLPRPRSAGGRRLRYSRRKPNPLLGFYAAITRQDRDGNPPGGWFPDQRMTREEALKSWTLDGAYAAFEEATQGSLSPGKLADFVMLSRDIMKVPPSEILKTRVTLAVVGGAVVYSEQK